MTPHLGFGLDGIHINGNLLYQKCNSTRGHEEKEEKRLKGGVRRRGFGKRRGGGRICSRT